VEMEWRGYGDGEDWRGRIGDMGYGIWGGEIGWGRVVKGEGLARMGV